MSKDTYRKIVKQLHSGDAQTEKRLEPEDEDGIARTFADIDSALCQLKNAEGSEEDGWTVYLDDLDREIIREALNEYRLTRARRGAPVGHHLFKGRNLILQGARYIYDLLRKKHLGENRRFRDTDLRTRVLIYAVERAKQAHPDVKYKKEIEPNEVLATKSTWETNEHIRAAFPDAEQWAAAPIENIQA